MNSQHLRRPGVGRDAMYDLASMPFAPLDLDMLLTKQARYRSERTAAMRRRDLGGDISRSSNEADAHGSVRGR